MPHRLMVVDDHKCIRDLVRLLCRLDEAARFTVVEEAADCRTALDRCRDARPDVVLLDICLPDRCGLMAGEQMRSLIPEAKIFFFTCCDEMFFLKEALRIGAAGYLHKGDGDVTRLLDTLQQVAEGGTVYPADAIKVLQGMDKEDLSADHLRALRLKAAGATTEEVAHALNKSAKACEKMLSSACARLGVRNTTHAVHVLTRRGLI